MHLVNLDGFSRTGVAVKQVPPMGLYFFLFFIFYTDGNFTIFTLMWHKEPQDMFQNLCCLLCSNIDSFTHIFSEKKIFSPS